MLVFISASFCGTLGRAQAPEPPRALSAEQIVSRLMDTNRVRASRLEHYTALRHYKVIYHGFPSTLEASMDAEVDYQAPSSKSFHIVSESGSKLLADRVLRKLLETEEEAAKTPERTAISPENYAFSLEGTEAVAGRQAYILHVEPLRDNRYLYRGRIWVDATDFAVVKIDAELAKPSSFWIAGTHIEHLYGKTGEFWLPETNRSETRVRVGGSAVLTIDYGAYHIGNGATQGSGTE